MLFELKGIPQFNEPIQLYRGPGLATTPSEYEDLDWYVQRVPELTRVVAAVQEDILGSGVSFTGKKQAINKAEELWENSFMREEVKKAVFDWLLYGDGYLWLGKFSPSELESFKLKALDKLEAKGFRHYVPELKIEEDAINFVRHVPSTNVNIDLNEEKTAILQFRQVVAGQQVNIWQPVEIVHAKFWTIKGKVYGFSPARSLLSEIQSIGYIKDYAKTWFEYGGTPDWMFAFPNEPPNSPRLKEMTGKLKKYKEVLGKHGNLIIGGEVKLTELNKFSKDMEFRQLLIQLTGIVAFAYGLPAGRISSIIGAEVKVSTGSDDIADEAYWSMIKGHQDYWEILLNTQVFSKFGDAEIHFPDTHKIDEVREAQAKMFTVDYITSLRAAGLDVNVQMFKELLGIEDDWLNSDELKDLSFNPNNRQGISQGGTNEELNRGSARQGYSNRKKKEQNTRFSDEQDTGV